MNPETDQKIAALIAENQSNREVMSLVAHELRTSLTSLKWMMKMLLDSDFGPVTSEQKNALTQGFSQNEHLIEIVTDLINFSHSNDTTIPYNMADADLVLIIESVIHEFSSESFKRGIPLVFNKPTGPLMCYVDKDKIKVLVQNLISNALKYSNAGHGVEIALTKDEQSATIIVRDHGIGIPAAEQNELFKKFFRAQNAKEKESVGSGLGLYTAYMIAQHHKGLLTCESAENIGTTCTVHLPLTNS